MARGSHGLPIVSPGPAMPDPFMPCGWATPEMALWTFQGWPACRAVGLQPSSILLDTPRRTSMLSSSSSSSISFIDSRFHYAIQTQARISWGIHGLPEVSLGPAMPYLSTPCRRPSCNGKAGGMRLSYTFLLSPWMPHSIR
jgi:hypothetical protein